jgi:hypothetical protein
VLVGPPKAAMLTETTPVEVPNAFAAIVHVMDVSLVNTTTHGTVVNPTVAVTES